MQNNGYKQGEYPPNYYPGPNNMNSTVYPPQNMNQQYIPQQPPASILIHASFC